MFSRLSFFRFFPWATTLKIIVFVWQLAREVMGKDATTCKEAIAISIEREKAAHARKLDELKEAGDEEAIAEYPEYSYDPKTAEKVSATTRKFNSVLCGVVQLISWVDWRRRRRSTITRWYKYE